MTKGKLEATILIVFRMNCWKCDYFEHATATERNYAGDEFRRGGWRYLGGEGNGWTCPGCIALIEASSSLSPGVSGK